MDVDITSFMPLITEASQSKNYAFEALSRSKNKDHEGYIEKINQSKECLINAHKKQTEILSLNARENETPITVYLIHAMDHVSNAQMVYDLAKELAEIHLNKKSI